MSHRSSLLLAFVCIIFTLLSSASADAPRYIYPTDCCAYKLEKGLQPTHLPLSTLGETQYLLTDNLLISKNGAEPAHCVGNTFSVWSTEGRNFTRRLASDGTELTTPLEVKNGATIAISPMEQQTKDELEGHLVKIDLDCSIYAESYLSTGRGTDCAFVWLGETVDEKAKSLPPCLGIGGSAGIGLGPTINGTDIDQIQPPAGVQQPNDPFITGPQTNFAAPGVDFSTLSFVIALLLACCLLQATL